MMKIEITFISGARAGQRLVLDEMPLIRLGRRSDNDVAFDPQQDLDVSGYHAEIRRAADGYHLYDMGSANGTFVGGQPAEGGRLEDVQVLTLGSNGPQVRVALIQGAEGSDDGAVGFRTVAMMISEALRRSQDQGGGVGGSTAFLRSLVSQSVRRSTRKFRVITVLLLVLLLATVAGAVALRYYEKRFSKMDQASLRREMTKLMKRQLVAERKEKEQLAGKLEQLNRRLARVTPATSGKEIVRRNLKAIFLMAYNDPLKGAKGYCTAFAVRKRVLATNAHCVLALERYRRLGRSSYVVMNRVPSSRYKITKVAHHPSYHKPRKTISKDVGLLKVGRDIPFLAELASDTGLQDLESGDIIYTYGFPGRLANVSSPSATLVQGIIGRITALDGRLGSFATNFLIQHSAFTSGGTSGSPIFNREGKVIAINAGSYVEPGSMQVLNPFTGRRGQIVVTKPLAGYNFGIRIDVLESLLDDIEE